MNTEQRTLDVSALPNYAFGHRGLIWWGTVGFMVIEASVFVIALITYFYLRLQASEWPPSLPNPDVGPGTVNLLLAALGCVPAALAQVAAERFDLRRVRVWLTVLTVVSAVNVVIRAFEYPALNCRWDDNAYASITWVLLSLHTVHIATDAVDSAVLAALVFIGPITKPRFVDVSENSLYWYFIVVSWIPIYLTVYFAPRWL
jgi:heme/copper-type cytochrome/quinol oxidase subunit 3